MSDGQTKSPTSVAAKETLANVAKFALPRHP